MGPTSGLLDWSEHTLQLYCGFRRKPLRERDSEVELPEFNHSKTAAEDCGATYPWLTVWLSFLQRNVTHVQRAGRCRLQSFSLAIPAKS